MYKKKCFQTLQRLIQNSQYLIKIIHYYYYMGWNWGRGLNRKSQTAGQPKFKGQQGIETEAIA